MNQVPFPRHTREGGSTFEFVLALDLSVSEEDVMRKRARLKWTRLQPWPIGFCYSSRSDVVCFSICKTLIKLTKHAKAIERDTLMAYCPMSANALRWKWQISRNVTKGVKNDPRRVVGNGSIYVMPAFKVIARSPFFFRAFKRSSLL